MPILANLAVLFHWSLADMESLPIDKLLDYHRLAIERSSLTR